MNCPYCSCPAAEATGRDVFPQWPHLATRRFMVCQPCDARVGINPHTGKPYGPLANAELRMLRKQCHLRFDPLWQRAAEHLHRAARAGAYAWLAAELGVPVVHFGALNDVETARRVHAFLTFLDAPPAVSLLVVLGEPIVGQWEREHAEPDIGVPGFDPRSIYDDGWPAERRAFGPAQPCDVDDDRDGWFRHNMGGPPVERDQSHRGFA